jgi:hypothetical protein
MLIGQRVAWGCWCARLYSANEGSGRPQKHKTGHSPCNKIIIKIIKRRED